MGFWIGDASLDRNTCLAIHGLGDASLAEVTQRTGELLCINGHVNERIQILPDDTWVAESIARLVAGGYVAERVSDLGTRFSPAKAITQGWP